ncbi:flagellar biosynthesis protein FlhF [Rossellomorea aquimaris]|uniref:flagellar biosynthesis protein FlhF n=1 Tax=Rossellomorea aquimaris TaxID=189382 RepID=UPI0007D086FD|nr:flagellar biosynthesis protein FlhF [Rossellomorea aquimaris]
MKVKKFVAPTMNEAMKKVRGELGDNAVILNSKVTFSGGFLGLFKKKMIEVIAAIDPSVEIEKKEMNQIRTETFTRVEETPKRNEQSRNANEGVHSELKELKQMIASIKSKSQFDRFTEDTQDILVHLSKHNVNEGILSHLGEYLDSQNKQSWEKNTDKYDWIREEVKKYFVQLLKDIPMGGTSFQKKFINVIGPTGVGKTTTLAKMAAEAVIEKRMKIGFITTDTYRIAAIEQLKTYAGLLNVPVEVVYKIDDFKKAIEKFKDFDHIFIDTAGRNFREKRYVEDLQKIIDFDHDMETYLVLALTSKEEDMKDIIAQFSQVHIDRFIFTKLDETSSYGSIINMINEVNLGAAYLTTGQDVPEDISEVTVEGLSHLLMKGFKDERSSL